MIVELGCVHSWRVLGFWSSGGGDVVRAAAPLFVPFIRKEGARGAKNLPGGQFVNL